MTDDIGRTVAYTYDGSGNLATVTDVRGETTTYGYDSSHRLTQIQDARGNTVTVNDYNTSGQIDWQKDAAGVASGLKTTYAYSTNGYGQAVTTVTSPEGRVSVLTFNAEGELVSKVDGSGTTSSVTTNTTFDPVCLAVTSETVTSYTDTSSHVHSWTYDPTTCELTADTDGLGHSIQYLSYNSLREPTSVEGRNGHTTTYTYDSRGNLTGSSAPIDGSHNQTTAYSYGDSTHPGDMTDKTDPDGQDWLSTYTSAGDVASQTAPATTHPSSVAGAETTYTYDGDGRLVSTVAPNGNASGGTPDNYRTVQLVDAGNNPLLQIDANGDPIADTFGRSNATSLGTGETGHTWSNATAGWHIAAGAATPTASGSFADMAGTADGGVAIISRTAQSGAGVVFRAASSSPSSNYWSLRADPTDSRWNLVKVVSGTAYPVGNTAATVATCCNANQLIVVTFVGSTIKVYIDDVLRETASDSSLSTNTGVGLYSTNSGSAAIDAFATWSSAGGVTQTVYDADGNKAATVDPSGDTTTYDYDTNNRLIHTNRANSTQLQTTYTADGLMSGQIDGNSKTTSYSYDAAGRLSTVTDPDSQTTTYTYTAVGNPATVTDADSRVTTYGYDAAERQTSISYSDAVTPNVTYGYDNQGDRTSMSDGTGSTSYSYDDLGRLTSTTDGYSNTLAYTYDAAGNQTSIAYPGSHTVTRDFDQAGRQYDQTDWLSNTTTFTHDPNGNLTAQNTPNGVTTTYTYDQADNQTAISDTAGSTTLAAWTYTRNPADQLAATTSTGVGSNETYTYNTLNQLSTSSPGYGYSYTYDNADNLTRLLNGNTLQYDNANRATTQKNPSGITVNSYGYNNEGDRTSNTATSSTNYTYDQANRLTTIGGTLSQYTYNGDGLLTHTNIWTVNSTLTWNTSTSLPQDIADGSTTYIYGPDNLPLEQITGTTVTWLAHDQLGSTRLLINNTGTTAGTYTYAPYGYVTNHTGTASTNLQYTGALVVDGYGTIYLHARWYDPTTGQFLSRDPASAATRTPYTYAGGDPSNNVDPSGLCLEDLCIVEITVLIIIAEEGPALEESSAVASDAGPAAIDQAGSQVDQPASGPPSAETPPPTTIPGGSTSGAQICEENAPHIFRVDPGHFAEDTPANRLALELTAQADYYLGTANNIDTYARSLPDGSQIWIELRNGQITNGGINLIPRTWNGTRLVK